MLHHVNLQMWMNVTCRIMFTTCTPKIKSTWNNAGSLSHLKIFRNHKLVKLMTLTKARVSGLEGK